MIREDLLDQVLLVGGDHVGRAGVEQGLPLRAAPRQGDGGRPDPVGDLDRRQADAARRRGDQDRIARLQAGDVDQGAVGGQVLHPDRRRLDPGERGGVVGHGMGRGVRELAVKPVGVQARSWGWC